MQHRRRLTGPTHKATVRMTPDEHAAWVEAARAEHLSLSAWVARELARASAASARRRRAAERETRGAA
jgi:predicted HicB family RNase H-like nuclease